MSNYDNDDVPCKVTLVYRFKKGAGSVFFFYFAHFERAREPAFP